MTRGIMVGTFIHDYRWGHQIRGDERGYVEKARRYRDFGVELYTLERSPSLQEGMGEEAYVSLRLGRCVVPPESISQLVVLSLRALRASVRRYPSRPIAIYAYNQDVENLWTGYLLKVALRAPLVVIYHQIRPAAFVPFRIGVADRVRRGFHPARAVLRSIVPALNRFAANHADFHIALSEATRRDVANYLGIVNCSVIGNGLDTARFRPLDLPKAYDAAFLGRLAHQKGVDVLLKAWSIVVQKRPDARLVLLGGGEPEDVARYKNLAKELELGRNVLFAGFVRDPELVRLMNSSKLFVFPSRQEGFAQAVSQAMGCGLCCILSDILALRGIYGKAALFSPVDNPGALADIICDTLEKEGEMRELGEKARVLAEGFSWEETVKGELGLILGGPGAAGGGRGQNPPSDPSVDPGLAASKGDE